MNRDFDTQIWALFRVSLNTTWAQVRDPFASRDSRKAWAGFEQAKGACMAGHATESVSFMNNQPLFELSAPAVKSE